MLSQYKSLNWASLLIGICLLFSVWAKVQATTSSWTPFNLFFFETYPEDVLNFFSILLLSILFAGFYIRFYNTIHLTSSHASLLIYFSSFSLCFIAAEYLLYHSYFLLEGALHICFILTLLILQLKVLRLRSWVHQLFIIAHHTVIAGVGFIFFPSMVIFLFFSWIYIVHLLKQNRAVYLGISAFLFFIPVYLLDILNYWGGDELRSLFLFNKIQLISMEVFSELFSQYIFFQFFIGLSFIGLILYLFSTISNTESRKYMPLALFILYLLFVQVTNSLEQGVWFYCGMLLLLVFSFWIIMTPYYRLVVCFVFGAGSFLFYVLGYFTSF